MTRAGIGLAVLAAAAKVTLFSQGMVANLGQLRLRDTAALGQSNHQSSQCAAGTRAVGPPIYVLLQLFQLFQLFRRA